MTSEEQLKKCKEIILEKKLNSLLIYVKNYFELKTLYQMSQELYVLVNFEIFTLDPLGLLAPSAKNIPPTVSKNGWFGGSLRNKTIMGS